MVISEQSSINELLATHFGFDELKPGQGAVIESLLAGKSAAAVFPTGGGKSLCYQLPSLVFEGLTLVVSPLIALMKDQIDALTARGIAARRLDSTLSLEEYRTTMDEVRSGKLRMLYVAPERFNNERFCETIQNTKISLFAIDEAHCISEWGHNFRPDYLRLAQFSQACKAERVLALTATATEHVLTDICRFLRIDPENAVRTGFYRSNLTLLATPVAYRKRDDVFIERLHSRDPGPTIVYVTTQRTAEELAGQLRVAGFEAKAYHAGMEDNERSKIQDWFISSDSGIVVATIAFGMGIDKSNIRYVYHYNPSKSLENYAQEIGRAGRDGQPAICEFFYCSSDLNILENFVYGDTPSAASIESFVKAIFKNRDEFDVSIYDLSSQHDIRINVVRTLITYLELSGYLEGGTPFYSTYKLKPLMPSVKILARFEGERKEFLEKIFRQMTKSKTWIYIDVDKASKAVGEPRDRIVRALDYLAEQKCIELQTSGVRNKYSIVRRPDNLVDLSATLFSRVTQREEREIARLRQVTDWVYLDQCQVQALGKHFAEPDGEPCGHCSWCLNGGHAVSISKENASESDDSIWKKAFAFQQQYIDVLSDDQSFARFLCGVTSPKLVRTKLQKDPLFGALSHIPLPKVMERIATTL